jgi:hypothetical protein
MNRAEQSELYQGVETAAAGKDWQGLVWMRMEREIWREEETE